MRQTPVSRRRLLRTAVATLCIFRLGERSRALAAPAEIGLANDLPVKAFDFRRDGIDGWTAVDGQWAVEDMAGVPGGGKVLVQRATKNPFNVILAPGGAFADLDVSMSFKSISGREDASGGIVFRFNDGKYYVVRANALEGNFRLYFYDRGRRQLASATVRTPALGQWHTVRVVALGDHVQAWLDGTRHLDHHDRRFKDGRVGLWTKADSITAFNDLTIRGVAARTP